MYIPYLRGIGLSGSYISKFEPPATNFAGAVYRDIPQTVGCEILEAVGVVPAGPSAAPETFMFQSPDACCRLGHARVQGELCSPMMVARLIGAPVLDS